MMTDKLTQAFQNEMNSARQGYLAADYDRAFYHLERAHILGQRFYRAHLQSHYWMFKVGLRRRDGREVIGQVFRMVASVASLIGRVPIGNTGGANVSPFKPMPIPVDLREFLS